MKQLILVIILLCGSLFYGQEKDKYLIKSNDFVYEGNELVNDDFISAEMEYRKAISTKPTNVDGAYNLGNAYYKNQKFGEAMLRHLDVIKSATTKEEKYKAYHNIGNALMQNKKCQEAVEAYKNALRNNPNDDETRYNLGLAKECAKEQGGGGGEDKNEEENEDQEKKEEDNKDQKEKEDEGEDKEENKDEGDQEEKEGEDKEDEDGKPKDEKNDEGKGEDKKKEQPKPQQGQLSPQQIKNLLEAMNDQEQKVQEKINAQKAKGAKVENDKDW